MAAALRRAAGLWRGDAASRALSGGGGAVAGEPFVEVRRYRLDAGGSAEYLKRCAETAAVRAELCPGFRGFFTTELGGDVNEVWHLYAYDGYDQRDATRKRMGADPRWAKFLADTKPALQAQHADVFLEATELLDAAGARPGGLAAFAPRNAAAAPVYELREYRLELGYNPIPKLREAFAKGLPSKVAADASGYGEPVFMGWSDVGELNRFVEVWRYQSCRHVLLAREAARAAAEWRATVQAVAPMTKSFSTTLLRPAPFSPLQ